MNPTIEKIQTLVKLRAEKLRSQGLSEAQIRFMQTYSPSHNASFYVPAPAEAEASFPQVQFKPFTFNYTLDDLEITL